MKGARPPNPKSHICVQLSDKSASAEVLGEDCGSTYTGDALDCPHSPPCTGPALILVALAAFTVACASGAEVSATTHRRTPAITHVHAVHRRTIPREVHRGVEARTQRRGAEKQTPEEVGRAAGLAMLRGRGLEQNRTTRRNLVYRRRGARPELRSVSIRTSPHKYRADTGRPVEAELATPSPASDTRRTDQEETAASPAAEWRRDTESRSAANEAVNERAAPKPTETNEYADRGPGFADGQAPRASHPEPEGDASMTEHPAAAQSTASYAAEAEEDGTDGNSATETEQASLYIPRGAMPTSTLWHAGVAGAAKRAPGGGRSGAD